MNNFIKTFMKKEKKEIKKRDMFSGTWIIDNAIEIVDRYEKGVLTIRALFYQLVSIGMTNSDRHYKRVVNAMIDARWAGLIEWDTFSDRDRTMVGETRYKETIYEDKVAEAKKQLGLWMTSYSKNRWENQHVYSFHVGSGVNDPSAYRIALKHARFGAFSQFTYRTPTRPQTHSRLPPLPGR